MKKLLLIPALIAGTLSMAIDYNYEVTPVIGYNIAEGNLGLDDYAAYGAELQYNGFDSIIKPELSVIYSEADFKSPSTANTDVWRVALNGVYEYDIDSPIIPLAKAGVGYENMADSVDGINSENTNSPFVDLGVGAKIPFNDMIALKLEAIYMLKYNDARYDNNLLVLAGLNFAFGEKAQKEAPVTAAPVVVTVVDRDDDKDGVLNSKDECPKTLEGVSVNAAGCDLDSDKDGVIDANDKCPGTATGTKVDASGCKIDGDDDKDGVLNSKDICPNTPLGEAVNVDGCPLSIALNINFENDSAQIKAASQTYLQTYADFLNSHTNYSVKIVGYTDSRGSESYNQKLSEKRAIAVAKDLISKGVNADQLTTLGRGEANPIADNSTSEGRAQNRRIEAELTRH